jgi:hypothetical protein
MSDGDTPEPDDVMPEGEPKKARRSRQAVARENRTASMEHVLSTRLGRAFVWAELTEGRVFQLSFAVGDSHLTAFNEGRRDRANKLLAEITAHHPEQYAKMAAEARDDALA